MLRTLGVIGGLAGLAGLFGSGCGGGGGQGAGGNGGSGNATGASGTGGGGSTGTSGSGGSDPTGAGGTGGAQVSFEPVVMGASWSYATTELNEDGGVVSGTKVVTVEASEAVPGRSGITAWRIHTVVPAMEDQLTWQAETGYAIVRYRDDIYAPGGTHTLMEYAAYAPSKLRMDTSAAHLTTGATYTETFTESDGSSSSSKVLTWKVVDGSESVTVPAGTFTTVHLQKFNGTSNKLDKDYWFARGVGKVKETSVAGRVEVLTAHAIP